MSDDIRIRFNNAGTHKVLRFTGEEGPACGISLVDAIPSVGNMMQAVPNRKELLRVKEVSERTVACLEVLLSHYIDSQFELMENGAEIEIKNDEVKP